MVLTYQHQQLRRICLVTRKQGPITARLTLSVLCQQISSQMGLFWGEETLLSPPLLGPWQVHKIEQKSIQLVWEGVGGRTLQMTRHIINAKRAILLRDLNCRIEVIQQGVVDLQLALYLQCTSFFTIIKWKNCSLKSCCYKGSQPTEGKKSHSRRWRLLDHNYRCLHFTYWLSGGSCSSLYVPLFNPFLPKGFFLPKSS